MRSDSRKREETSTLPAIKKSSRRDDTNHEQTRNQQPPEDKKGQPASLCPVPKTCPTSWLCNRRILDFCLIFAYRSLVTYSGNEQSFLRCFQKTEKQIIIHRPWCDCRSESTGLTGETRSLSAIRRIKGLNARQLCPQQTGAYQPERHYKHQSPETNGSTPDIQRMDPRCTETGPLVYQDWTPDVRKPDPRGTRPQDTSPRREQRTSWDSRLRGT